MTASLYQSGASAVAMTGPRFLLLLTSVVSLSCRIQRAAGLTPAVPPLGLSRRLAWASRSPPQQLRVDIQAVGQLHEGVAQRRLVALLRRQAGVGVEQLVLRPPQVE